MTAGKPSGIAATATRKDIHELIERKTNLNKQTESNGNFEIVDSTTKP
jgi:hypothetical protein